jgi:RND family efflux transporter MFP subunit
MIILMLQQCCKLSSQARQKLSVCDSASATWTPMSWVIAIIAVAILPSASLAQSAGGSYVGDMAMTYDGFTQPKHEIMVASDEMGRIESVDVTVGDRVEAGQVIATLEDSMQVASLKTAKIQADMVGEMNAAKVELELNQVRAEKLRELASKKMARPDELRRGEADLRIAKARVASMEEQLNYRKAELERAQALLKRRTIRAPMTGVIAEIFLSPGEAISPSSPSVAEMLVVNQLIAIFDMPVEDTLQLEIGSPVRVRLRSIAESVDALITSISPKIDGESGTVQVRVELDNAKGRLRSGDRCTLQILEGRPAYNPAAQARGPKREEHPTY